jgi:serine/threonine-protein kinase HipA
VIEERLGVHYRGAAVAELCREEGGDLALRYDPEVVGRLGGGVLISASLPVRGEPYRTAELLPFFDGLLPEGQARRQLARRLRLDETDVFGFLREIGRDCAGAISLLPEGEEPDDVGRPGVEWLDGDDLEQEVADLVSRPLGVEPARGVRISLAGAQSKLAVVVSPEGRIGLPRGTTASTHILKPGSVERWGLGPAYPGLVANEAFCLRLGRRLGLEAPPARLIRIGGEPVLLIERYDRVHGSDGVERLHQEDFCQALGVPSYRKYEADGGPGLLELVETIRRLSIRVTRDLDMLVDRVVLDHLVGNADAHAKNFALLYTPEGPVLAPAYDIISTAVYPHLARPSAMAIGGSYEPEDLSPEGWREGLAALGLSPRRYRGRIAELVRHVLVAAGEVRDRLDEEGAGGHPVDAIEDLIRRRAALLAVA